MLRIVLDHMLSSDHKPESITITAKLTVAVKASQLKNEQAKIEKAEKKLKYLKKEQFKIITKEINELNTKVSSLKKVNEQLDMKNLKHFYLTLMLIPPKLLILLLRQLL